MDPMSSSTVRWKALKFDLRKNLVLESDAEVTFEQLFDLFVNGNLYITTVLTPFQLKEWAVGFLYSEGLISSASDVKEIKVGSDSIEVETRSTECEGLKIGRFLPDSCATALEMRRILFVNEISREILSNQLVVPREVVKNISIRLNKASTIYRTTGGTHSAAIFDEKGRMMAYSEDVGRHNAVDKVIGDSLLKGIRLRDKILAVSGRLSEDLVFKCARAKIPFVISLSAPLSRGLKLAEMAGITLIGFARGNRFNVYTHPSRVH